MKKTLILTMAIVAIASFGATDAAPANLDHVQKNFLSDKKLQNNYLDALKIRYQRMYNNKMMDAESKNAYNQKESIKKSQKDAHIMGGLKSILSRTGELEQDKDRVQKKTPYQIQAVNSKSVFLKRAMDYYVYNGDAGSEIMKEGNINMRDHKVARRKMLNLMYKHRRDIGDITLDTRNLQKNMVAPEYKGLIERRANYKKGDFSSNMISPYTSLKWLTK